MADDLSIGLGLGNLPGRPSVGRSTPSGPQGTGQEKPTKSIGDPPPPRARLADYPEPVRQTFAYSGILSVLCRKLNALTGESYSLVPAQGHQVCINENGQVHVGCDFIGQYLNEHAILAGVLAHEWGHFPNRRNYPNLDTLPWSEVYRLRREEETKADMFCGRALFLLSYRYEPLIHYLKVHEDPKKKSPKYHTVASRAAVISKSYHSQNTRHELAHNLKHSDSVYGDPIHTTKLIGS